MRRPIIAWLVIGATSCRFAPPSPPLDTDPVGDTADSSTEPPNLDVDGDGWNRPRDCDDDDAEVHPEAPEICNDKDDDCDGLIDDEDEDVTLTPTWFEDHDGDGYGDEDRSTAACDQPSGYVADSSDCDDNDPKHHDDCEPARDEDRDGWINLAAGGYDCDDTDATVKPWHCGHPDDLVVDGTTVPRSGQLIHRGVWVVDGGVLEVAPYEGQGDRGWVSIDAAIVYVDPGSKIDAAEAGYRGAGQEDLSGEGPGGGSSASQDGPGAGAGHGAAGHDGVIHDCQAVSAGGDDVGTRTDGELRMGSGGGTLMGSSETGCRGGGAIGITASQVLIQGELIVDGQDCDTGTLHDGAGGAGGSVIITSDDLSCSGLIRAQGGNGYDDSSSGPGAGAGGRVQLFTEAPDLTGCSIDVQGGTGPCTDILWDHDGTWTIAAAAQKAR